MMNCYKQSWIISILFLVSTSLYSQTQCKLYLKEGKLSGDCANTYIIKGFEIDIMQAQIDSTILFDNLPLSGSFIIDEDVYDTRYASTKSVDFKNVSYELTNRDGFPQILIKTKLGWFTMDDLEVTDKSISFRFDLQPTPPVAETDLQVIRIVKELLKGEEFWHKEDDRDCTDDINNKKYSLFCALKIASVEVEGAYNHRSAIMQKVRIHINNLYPNKVFAHRLRDYNNMPETTYTQLMALLNSVENEVVHILEQKR